MILSQFTDEVEAATAAHMTRLVTFFNVWRQVPFESEKKLLMLQRGAMEPCEQLRAAVVGYVMDVREGRVKPYVAGGGDGGGGQQHQPEIQALLTAMGNE